VPKLLLAQPWDNDANLTDWLDEREARRGAGVVGRPPVPLTTKATSTMHPNWFTAELPSVPLDGELWLDRKAFQPYREHRPAA